MKTNDRNVSEKYLENRSKILTYMNKDMNLKLENDDQVYIAVFDIPVESGIREMQTQSLALVFGLNTILLSGNGSILKDLEKNENIMKAMQSLLISSHQVLGYMNKTSDISFYESNHVRVYFKTRQGIFFRELSMNDNIDKFILAIMNNVMIEISKNC